MPLTELAIKHLKPKAKLYRIADGNGLCLEISPSGGKLWRWRYYYQGKAQMLALGKYPSLSLAEARKKRDDARDLLDTGKHPTREKKIQRIRKAHEGSNTFEKIARKWLEMKDKNLNEKYRKQCLARMEEHIFPKIGDLPITDITIPDIVEVIEEISKLGIIETARRMKQIIGQVFRYASQRGLCKHNPAVDLRDILPSTEEKHHACIHLSELPELLAKIDARGNDFTKYAMKLLMLTFVRTSELIGAKWEEINWRKEEWHIPKERMKMRRPHLVPLSRQAIKVLKELQDITGNQNYIFFNASTKNKHISNGVVLMGLRRMGYKNKMTGHGFRTIASTLLNEKNYPPDVIERQLAHADNDKIRAAYNRAEYVLERKKMMQDYADILEGLQKNYGKNVVYQGIIK